MREHYLRTNRESWDARTREHVRSTFYDVDGFLAGACTLKAIERETLADVRGKRILHLQCHFGLDTLSLARLGADVTGIDLSPASIEEARAIANRAGLSARFVTADVYDALGHIDGAFDIVFASYGAIEWLPELRGWARVVAAALKPGGALHLVDFHPYAYALQGEPYFHQAEPKELREKSYTENAEAVVPLYVWSHSVSDILNGVIGAGLAIERFDEHAFSPYDCFPDLVEKEPGRFYRRDAAHDVPMVLSLKARRR